MEEQRDLIDLNTADIETLTSLPGIGSSMAERIIAARPFNSPEDLNKVSGIGPNTLEPILPLVFCSTPKTADEPLPPAVPTTVLSEEEIEELATEASAEEVSAAELLPEDVPSPEYVEAAPETEELAAIPLEVEEEAPVETPPEVSAESTQGEITQPEELVIEEPSAVSEEVTTAPSEPVSPPDRAAPPTPTVTSERAFGIALASSILTLIFSVVFTLIFLAILNGGLRYAHPEEVNSLRRSIHNVESEALGMQQNLADLQARVDNLEGLSGRLTKTEQQVTQLRQDLDAVAEQAVQLGQQTEQLAKQVNEMASQLEDLQKNSNRFQNFLDGLRELLNMSAEPGQK